MGDLFVRWKQHRLEVLYVYQELEDGGTSARPGPVGGLLVT